jgi:hypothetical protein
MEHISTEARRVPLRIQILGIARQHAAEYALDPAVAIGDIHTIAKRLSEHDLTAPIEPQLER